MFCPNCGKRISDRDNFCKYCGNSLSNEEFDMVETVDNAAEEPQTVELIKEKNLAEIVKESEDSSDEEEFVIFEVKKHWMALFWPLFFAPIGIAYFWKIYIVAQSIFGFLFGLLILAPIVYPILRYYYDKMVITNKFIHIQQGIFDIEDVSIPLKNSAALLYIKRSMIGQMCDYGHIMFESQNKSRISSFRFIQNPDEIKYLLNNPDKYINEIDNEETVVSVY